MKYRVCFANSGEAWRFSIKIWYFCLTKVQTHLKIENRHASHVCVFSPEKPEQLFTFWLVGRCDAKHNKFGYASHVF
jgi:hypothetical protein